MKKHSTGAQLYLIALIFVMGSIWGLSFMATNIAVSRFEPIQTLTLRWTWAALVFLLLAALGKVRLPTDGGGWRLLAATGAMMPCLYGLFEAEGIRLTSISESAVLIGSIPVVTLLMGSLRQRGKGSWLTAAGIFLSFFGVAVCTVPAPGFTLGGKLQGYVCLLVAVFAGAAFMHLSHEAGKRYDSMQITAAMSLIGCVFFNVLNLAKGYGLATYKGCLDDPEAALACLFLGVLCSSLCYLLMNYVLARMENTAVASNLSNCWTTVVGVLSGIVIMSDPFGWYTAAGLLMIVAGMVLSARRP